MTRCAWSITIVATVGSATVAVTVPSEPFTRAAAVFPGSMLSCGGSTMIGGWVGVASGAGEADSVGPGDAGDSVGGAGAAEPPGDGVTTLPGGLTGPDDGGATGGFTC